MGVMSSSSNLKSVIPHPVRMRAVPTVTYDNITADDDVASYSASNIQSVGTNTGSFDVSAPPWTCASFSATGRPARIITTAAGGYIDLSAEL